MSLTTQLSAPKRLRYTYKTEPYAYQRRALAKIAKLEGRAGLWMEMGTGKTKVAIDWVGISYINFNVNKAIVVCPISVLRVWEQQIALHSPFQNFIKILEGSTDEKVATLKKFKHEIDLWEPEGVAWVLVNYESIWRPLLEEELGNWDADIIICDESHRIKSASARQSRSAARLGREARMRLALTGTPITKSPLDAFDLVIW